MIISLLQKAYLLRDKKHCNLINNRTQAFHVFCSSPNSCSDLQQATEVVYGLNNKLVKFMQLTGTYSHLISRKS